MEGLRSPASGPTSRLDRRRHISVLFCCDQGQLFPDGHVLTLRSSALNIVCFWVSMPRTRLGRGQIGLPRTCDSAPCSRECLKPRVRVYVSNCRSTSERCCSSAIPSCPTISKQESSHLTRSPCWQKLHTSKTRHDDTCPTTRVEPHPLPKPQ